MSAGNEREFIDHLQNKEGKEHAIKMRVKCFGCGKFIKLGTGKVAKATDPKRGSIQYFCEPCVEERMEYKRREKGPGASFNDYIGLNKLVEFV